MSRIVNRVVETTQTTGTGTLDLDGAQTGFQAFSAWLSSGQVTVYLIEDDPASPSVWEIGFGTWTAGSPNTLSRDTVLASSNGGSKISLAAGTTYVVTGTVVAAVLQPGGISRTAAYTVAQADRGKAIFGDASGGDFTVTLPAASLAGDGFRVSVVNVGASGTVTVDANAAENINGAATRALDVQWEAVVLRCDGTNWVVEAEANALSVPDASDTVKGVIEIAVQSEMEAAASNVLAVTPGRMHQYPGMAKAVVRLTALGSSPPTINEQHNVLGALTAVRNGIGDHELQWTNSVTNATAGFDNESNVTGVARLTSARSGGIGNTSVRFITSDTSGNPVDPDSVTVRVYGNLA